VANIEICCQWNTIFRDFMRFIETNIFGAKVIDPSPHEDERGRFMRARWRFGRRH
jgi:hypothetical protein